MACRVTAKIRFWFYQLKNVYLESLWRCPCNCFRTTGRGWEGGGLILALLCSFQRAKFVGPWIFLRPTSFWGCFFSLWRGRMTEIWFWLKDFKPRGERHGRALLAPLKQLFVFPSSLELILMSLCWCWASMEDTYWTHKCFQSAGKARGWCWRRPRIKDSKISLCFAKFTQCTCTEVVVWGNKVTKWKGRMTCLAKQESTNPPRNKQHSQVSGHRQSWRERKSKKKEGILSMLSTGFVWKKKLGSGFKRWKKPFGCLIFVLTAWGRLATLGQHCLPSWCP